MKHTYHWFRVTFPKESVEARQIINAGFTHGLTLDCGETDCQDCLLWRDFIPTIDILNLEPRSPLATYIIESIERPARRRIYA